MPLNKLEIVWNNMVIESRLLIDSEPMLTKLLYTTLLQHGSFKDALAYMLSKKLDSPNIDDIDLNNILKDIYDADTSIVISAAYDIYEIYINDPSVNKYMTPFLYLKGFHALQGYRVAHWLWINNRLDLAMYLYNHITTIFNVDIHPAAEIGRGIVLDHATGVVIGETAVIENNVSIMQGVTLGSTGKKMEDGNNNRHPKIRQGVLLGAGSIILGNIEIGPGSKVGAGSVVLHSVPSYSTVTGKPAKII